MIMLIEPFHVKSGSSLSSIVSCFGSFQTCYGIQNVIVFKVTDQLYSGPWASGRFGLPLTIGPQVHHLYRYVTLSKERNPLPLKPHDPNSHNGAMRYEVMNRQLTPGQSS
ncbi:hypothetical protein QVD17_18367 [Tagetes erecta]|uniref:Uncharacterized protein n=1 Tax=Tagetes erecta TaxID=13708 RepID=A0AAD8KHS8_TARER|nr:hypothetical protein QVD17_18367 [Tagetes erecta]